MEKEYRKIVLSDGTEVNMEVTPLSGRQPVGIGEKFDFKEVLSSIKGLTNEIKEFLTISTAQKTTIEFGLEIGVESTGLCALIVKGTGSANLKITLEWESKKSDG